MFLKLLEEFKKFAVKGNAIDLAVGVIIGAAFGKVVTSLTNDIIMPPIGLLLGKLDFSMLKWTIYHGATEATSVSIRFGSFINTLIDFLIVSFVIFICIRQMNQLRIPFVDDKPALPTTKECPYCCSTIAIKATRCPDCTSELPPM